MGLIWPKTLPLSLFVGVFGLIMLQVFAQKIVDKAADGTKNEPIAAQSLLAGDLMVRFIVRENPGKPTLLFIHGSPGASSDFKKYFKDSLLATRFTLVSIDRPGFGLTGGRSMPNLHDQAQAVSGVLKRFSAEPICLVGHSYGGPLAVQLAVDYPKLVQGLVLLAPALDPELEKDEWQRPLIKSKVGLWIMGSTIQHSNDELMTLREDLKLQKQFLRDIHVPVIHIHGTWDMFVDSDNLQFSKRFFSEVPYLKTIELKRVNHFIPWTHYQLIKKQLLDFESHWAKTAASENRP